MIQFSPQRKPGSLLSHSRAGLFSQKHFHAKLLADPRRAFSLPSSWQVLFCSSPTESPPGDAPRSNRRTDTAGQFDREWLLAGGIAHDFNNLLTAIIGNISLASLLLAPNDELATRLTDAKNASLRARDLAQQLLTFARDGAPIK